MAQDYEREDSQLTRVVREAREQATAAIDYDSILAVQYAGTVAAMGTLAFDAELEKLRVILHPWFDDQYRRSMKSIQEARARFVKMHREQDWDSRYQTLHMNEITDLMKRAGLMPLGMV